MELVTGVNGWAMIPVVMAGAAYAYVLYARNRRLPFSVRLKALLFVLRMTAVSLIAFLLLSPHLVLRKKLVEKPLILIAQDNSASITAHEAAPEVNGQPLNLLLAEKLAKTADVQLLTFGAEVKEDGEVNFLEQKTDLSELLLTTRNTYFNRNVGALVLLTDGIHNSGIQPEITAASYPFPVCCLALGDTNQYTDLSISDVRYNRLVYHEDNFPVEVSIRALNADGQRLTVELLHESKTLAHEEVVVHGNRFAATKQFRINSPASGRIRITAKVSELPGERLVQNNRQSFFVDVVNQKQRILFYAAAPHPDLGALKAMLNNHYELEQLFAQEPLPKAKTFDLIVLHNLPSVGGNFSQLTQLLKAHPEAALLFVNGIGTDFVAFNNLQSGLKVFSGDKQQWAEAVPLVNPHFSLFLTENEWQNQALSWPAVDVPLAEVQTSPGFHTFLNQKVNGIQTNNPMIGFMPDAEKPTGYFLGNGFWKWRLADYRQNGNHENFGALVQKTIQLLLVRKDHRRLRIFHEPIVMLNEYVKFRAELYNQSMMKVNDHELKIRLTHIADGTEYQYVFNQAEDGYSLNAGRLPEGEYRYRAEVQLGEETLQEEGFLLVERSSLESMNLTADHELLKRIAAATGGKFFEKGQEQQLIESLKENPAITSTATHPKVYDLLINLPWLLVLILGLLAMEWLLRKANGAY